MEFNKGMVGVLLVILSLVGSVAVGLITNVESKTVTKEVEDYVADITGGFDSEKDKSYTDYNPSSNYNGYTNNTTQSTWPVIYEPSDYTNNYPISFEIGDSGSSFTSITDFTTESTPVYVRFAGYQSYHWNESHSYGSYDFYITGPETYPATGSSPGYIKDLSGVIQECLTESTSIMGIAPDTITISLPSIVSGYVTTPVSVGGYAPLKFGTVWYLTNSVFVAPSSTGSTYTSPITYTNLETAGANSDYSSSIVYDVNNDSMSYLVNGSLIYTGSPQNYKIVYGQQYCNRQSFYYPSGGSSISAQDVTALPNTTSAISVKYTSERHLDHIDTRYGVGVRNGDEVVWSNKQQNGITTIAFSTWTTAGSTINFDESASGYSNTGVISYFGTDTTDSFTVSRTGGRTYVSLNGGSPVDIGTWRQIQLDIDSINGKLIVYPIDMWDNFNNYSVFGTSIEIGNITKANLRSITWTADNTFRFEVENTYVFFNTYGVVMIDPHITIANLWPNYDRFSVHISGVATVGNSITIGNTSYDIDNNYFTVNGTSFDVTDLTLEYTKKVVDNATSWDVTIGSGKNRTTVTESNTYLGFTGSWYFTAGFYNIITKDVVERTWNAIYDWGKGHIFFWMAGVLLILGLGAYKLGYMDGPSAIIIITAEVILFIIGGTT